MPANDAAGFQAVNPEIHVGLEARIAVNRILEIHIHRIAPVAHHIRGKALNGRNIGQILGEMVKSIAPEFGDFLILAGVAVRPFNVFKRINRGDQRFWIGARHRICRTPVKRANLDDAPACGNH